MSEINLSFKTTPSPHNHPQTPPLEGGGPSLERRGNGAAAPSPSFSLRGTGKRGLFQIPNSKLQTLLEYGFYLFIFLLPWQTHLVLRSGLLNRGVWEYGTISLYGTDILLAGLLIIIALQYFCHPERSGSEAKDLSCNEVLKSSRIIDPSPGAQDDKNNDVYNRDKPRSRLFFGQKTWIKVILSGLDLAVFVSIFFAPDKVLALYRYALFLLGIGLFWLVVKIRFNKAKLAMAFFSGLLIQAALAIQQFLTQGAFASKWLGMAAHDPGDLGASVVETAGRDGIPERWLRAYGSLPHPNILGAFLAAGLIIFIFYFIHKKGAALEEAEKADQDRAEAGTSPGISAFASASADRQDGKKGGPDANNFFIFYFIFLALFAALLFTFSRSAWLALAAGVCILFIAALAGKDRSALRRLGLAVILAFVVAGIIFASYQNLFLTRAQGSARLEVKSFSERKMYQDDSLALIKRNWLFGAGLGNYTKALAVKEPHRPWYYLQPAHNVFLLVWAETGIFGLIFFLAFLVCLFWQAAKKKSVLSLSILAALVIMMIFDHYLWSLPVGVLFFWLLAGYVFKKEETLI